MRRDASDAENPYAPPAAPGRAASSSTALRLLVFGMLGFGAVWVVIFLGLAAISLMTGRLFQAGFCLFLALPVIVALVRAFWRLRRPRDGDRPRRVE